MHVLVASSHRVILKHTSIGKGFVKGYRSSRARLQQQKSASPVVSDKSEILYKNLRIGIITTH